MSKYRILEKEGEYKPDHDSGCWYGVTIGCDYCVCDKTEGKTAYIPRFIVQEEKETKGKEFEITTIYREWEDLKEFSSLKEAREYKRKLELKEGIVRE